MQLKNLGRYSSQTEAWDGLDPNQFLRFLHKFLAKVASGSGNTRTECFQRAEILSYFPSAPVILSKPAMSFVKKLKACDGWSYDTLTPLPPPKRLRCFFHVFTVGYSVFFPLEMQLKLVTGFPQDNQKGSMLALPPYSHGHLR